MNVLSKIYRCPPLVLGMAVLAGFLPVLIFTYGRLDDMALAYWFARDFTGTMRDIFIAQGRPILGVFLGLLLYPVSTFGDLVWLRLLAVMLTFGLTLQFFHFLRASGVGYFGSLMLALVMVANPGIAAINGWAICCTHILGCVIAFAIGVRAVNRLNAMKQFRDCLAIATTTSLLLLGALFIYQPAAAFVLLPPAIHWLLNGRGNTERQRLIWVAAAYLAALAIYFIGMKLVVDFWLQLNTQSDRSALVADIPGKLAFLVDEPLRLLTLSWAYFLGSTARTFVSVLTVGLLFLAALSWLRRDLPGGLRDIVLTAALFIAGLVSLIVLQVNYAPFRVLTFGYVLMATLIGLSLRAVVTGLNPGSLTGRLSCALGVLSVVTVVAGNHLYLRIGMGEPFEREYLHYRHAMSQQIGDNLPKGVLWAIPDHFDLRGQIGLNRIRYEFGTLSSGMEYVVPGMTWMLLSELYDVTSRGHPLWAELLRVETVPLRLDRQWRLPEGLPFMDGPAIFGREPARSSETMQAPWEHPVLGQVENLYNGWNFSPSFGIFNSWIPEGVYHIERGLVPLTPAP